MYKVIKFKKGMMIKCVVSCLVFFASIFFTVKATQIQKVEVPIIMYHSILKDSTYHGSYVISPTDFENDLIYLKENGYTAIGTKELLDYTSGKGDLPEKPIVLSFDDGYYNNYVYAYPLAKKYQMKIVISPIMYWSEKSSEDAKQSANYSHCNFEQITEMSNSGFVDFGNHTYNLHTNDKARNGVKKVVGESLENYEKVISTDINKAQEMLEICTGEKILLFTYPFGAVSKETPQIIEKLGFKITFSCEEKINTITKEEICLQNLGRFLRPYNKSVKQILS